MGQVHKWLLTKGIDKFNQGLSNGTLEIVDLEEASTSGSMFIELEEWMRKGCKWYWIKKQIEPFFIHPLIPRWNIVIKLSSLRLKESKQESVPIPTQDLVLDLLLYVNTIDFVISLY